MSGPTPDARAEALGIVPVWRGIDGVEHVVSPETKHALVAAMGETALHPPVPAGPDEIVLRAGEPGLAPLPSGTGWTLVLETGEAVADGVSDGAAALPATPMGLHRMILRRDGAERGILVISAPPRAPSLADLGHGRLWGVTGSIHGLRSARDLGIGDYVDLGTAAAALGRLGAAFFGVNPLHAPGEGADGISPYSPTHRGFLNPDYIAPDAIEGFDVDPEITALATTLAPRAAELRAAELIDHAGARDARRPLLEALRHRFRAHGEHAAFARWRGELGEGLENFARYEALAERHGPNWPAWPADPAPPEAERIAFHAWLQWVCERQIAAAQAAARSGGMALGLYLDIAVGVRPDGAEVWAAPDGFAREASLGAPPDHLAPAGQDWGLAPLSPPGLRRALYRPFIDTLRATMRHAGVVRIDHVLGLNRCFWVPRDGAPGGYVSYPRETMLAIVKVEAWRARCLVVGEDLGVVPDDLRARLSEAGLLGCAVMQFERDWSGFFHPRDYRADAIASFGTHDTPTLRGWMRGRDIDWRERLGEARDVGAWRRERAEDRRALGRTLVRDPDDEEAMVDGAHRALASGVCELAAAQLDDALGVVEQPNLPGDVDRHPNWRRRAPVAVEDFSSDPGLRRCAEAMNREQSQ